MLLLIIVYLVYSSMIILLLSFFYRHFSGAVLWSVTPLASFYSPNLQQPQPPLIRLVGLLYWY
jgi:hypothetical protein